MAAAFPVVSGPVGGAPEIHEKIARNGRGAVVIFAKEGTFRYVTENRPDHRVWHDEGTQVDFDASGHAVITATFAPEAAQFPKAGARIIFFGAQ